jgi:hypothetical protein
VTYCALEPQLVRKRSLTIVKKTIDLRVGGSDGAEIKTDRQTRCIHLFVEDLLLVCQLCCVC